MSASLERVVGMIEGQVKAMEKRIDGIADDISSVKDDISAVKNDIAKIRDIFQQVQGGSKVLMFVCSALGGGGVFAALKYLPMIIPK
jgi:archaellum component FlaC